MYSIYYRNVLQEISGDLRGEEKGTFLPESESERRRCQNGRSPQPWTFFGNSHNFAKELVLYDQKVKALCDQHKFMHR